jgi:GNAT superfamily N-acetyltransferase
LKPYSNIQLRQPKDGAIKNKQFSATYKDKIMQEDPTLAKFFSFQIRNELKPGDMGTIIYLHGVIYEKEYGFDCTFEPYVAEPLSKFILFQSDKERIWIAQKDGKIVGSVAIVKFSDDQAQLRWLLVHPEARGYGLGKTLVEKAIQFSKINGYRSIFLWTLDILPVAAKLYQSLGFKKTDENPCRLWGVPLTEHRYEITLQE